VAGELVVADQAGHLFDQIDFPVAESIAPRWGDRHRVSPVTRSKPAAEGFRVVPVIA